MKKLFFILVLLAFPFQGLTQFSEKTPLDSLFVLLKNANESTVKVDLLNQIGLKYWESGSIVKKDSVKYFILPAIKLARKLSYNKGIAEGLYHIGRYHIASANNFAEATPSFLESLALFEELKDNYGIAKCYLQLGLISYILQYFEDAIKNFKLSLHYSEITTTKYLMALSYSELDNYPESKKYFSMAITDFEKSNQNYQVNECYMFLGKLHLKMGQTDSAFYFLNKVIDEIKAENDTLTLIRPYAFISTAYFKINDLNNAIYFAEKSYNMSTGFNDEISLIEATETLSKAYALKGNFKKAYYFLNLSIKSKDIFFTGSTKQKVADMQSMFDFKKKMNDQKVSRQREKDLAQQQIQKEKILRNSFLAGAALLMLLLLVLYNRYKLKQSANLALEEKNIIISKEKERSESLLLNILPWEVAEELKAKGTADAKQFEEVTVMFTDFKDFTQISEKLTPSELVAEIHSCFKVFDEIITRHNIEKIKTIGDSYMCAGGLPVANKTHATDVVLAALEIQQFMQTLLLNKKLKNKDVFEIRIGVHTGTVVAGIVGVKKFAYDIWGDTVNIASRMESSGESGKVNISGSTYELVKDKFKCFHRGKIHAKNKGEIDMYFVSSDLSES